MSYIRFTGFRMLPLSFFIPDVPRAGFCVQATTSTGSSARPVPPSFGPVSPDHTVRQLSPGLTATRSNSSAVSAPNSPCLRHRNRTVVAPAAISSSPWHSVHSNSTWTVFPSSLIFIANLISILITFRLIAGFIVQFTLYSPQNNSELIQWPFSRPVTFGP
jgi:hypothetical protein